ncbi:S-adenosylmethionine:tRNA ribosyltransferase-isomerase [Campylobacter sputorum subsp. bubulus]|uniref:S-adenosylmethionine:tRNA ribosyltransferase-isomerase n=1 Tax=Campylobacter sputorum subsp. sputorum TaxID=32024 RepID=A0A381DIM8_9BACT|nr:tRNA preQ1(34) S-adenosylmethionine ribosyltransferase-isomerase QueA [Campylobacter sputorum]ASM35571.1 S-adenosylmethionine:tRNA ribosyltransferase-isomerase [Campylobacter sputorum aubsp. sputorum RM3237]KAB0582696.1 tRNA preQ1(34) S-adenosylmethionine ribosyltransferase-isomerase QueA [Campylobacter sputorum subsp. sputorum]QEL05762.1 S-adenosylmethionine:tRNA ribosyltransferase-isomerase [Campylobacter sputorum subsp. sputorum]SUX08133.1 S-adenosylmethionine:tRNA ribosyltransferase-isom
MIDLLKTSSYDYFLPQEFIAKEPVLPRENAKMLVYDRKKDTILHKHVKDLPEILPECSIVFNDTKVVKARAYGVKSSGGKVEILLNAPLINGNFGAYIKGRVKVGSEIALSDSFKFIVKSLFDDGLREVEFYLKDKKLNTTEVFNEMDCIGHVPIPPYIKRDDNKNDEIWYQSIFAKYQGAVAAPTASLHFSSELVDKLKINYDIYTLTLHVGAGTFKGIESEDITKHKMHEEWYHLPQNTINLINSTDKILGIGTTVTRVIEDFARNGRSSGVCELFLNPFNKPIRQDYLLTNFHLPKSTLIMLVCSFIGFEKTMEIYDIAIKNNYRFYSYGDCMLVL